MYDEFTVVKSKKNRRKSKAKNTTCAFSISDDETYDGSKLNSKLNEIRTNFPTDHFILDLVNDLKSISDILSKDRIDHILCFGLGKFSNNSASLHQLAVLIHLQKTFSTTVDVYDPVFSECDRDFLNELNISVINVNEEGKRVIDKDKLTIVYLPHCPKQLINNFLWANWNENIRNCVLISNSFSKILQDNTRKTISESAFYIEKFFEFCEERTLKDNYYFPNVFNDISVHFVKREDLILVRGEEPCYTEDTEFVTK